MRCSNVYEQKKIEMCEMRQKYIGKVSTIPERPFAKVWVLGSLIFFLIYNVAK